MIYTKNLIPRFLSILALLLFTTTSSIAQDRIYRLIKSAEYNQDVQLEDNSTAVRSDDEQSRNILTILNSTEVNEITIPVVFHVLYDEPDQKIALNQIYTQLAALNRDYNFRENTEVEPNNQKQIGFCLAHETGVDGINYVQTSVVEWKVNNDMKLEAFGGTPAISPDQYLNIWVVNLKEKLGGFAQFPGKYSQTDGIVIDYQFVGIGGSALAPYDEGKSLSHLVGNYLGLYSLWGPGKCMDDGVEDTPIHNTQNYGCPTGNHISLCDGRPLELVNNFMDNTFDACMTSFTSGQINKIFSNLKENKNRHEMLRFDDYCEQKDATAFVGIGLKLTPNPVSSLLTVEWSKYESTRATRIEIVNINGHLIYDKKIEDPSSNQLTLDVGEWPGGVYFLKGHFDNGVRKTQSFVIID